MKEHHSDHYPNYYKIYKMGVVQLAALELVLNFIELKNKFIRRAHWVGMMYPERKKYCLHLRKFRLHVWVSVDTRTDL